MTDSEKMGFRFTWRSLAICGAIVAVIAAVALPSYGDYTHRAQISEALVLMANARPALEEHRQKQGSWPTSTDGFINIRESKYVQRVAITQGAGGTGEFELTATLREDIDRRVAGKSLVYRTRDGGKSWTCRRGTASESNVPLSCRENQ